MEPQPLLPAFLPPTRAGDDLVPDLYQALRRLAARRMNAETPGHSLQPTALVHEAYLRLIGTGRRSWDGPAHFYGAAAEAMRRILIESARRRKRTRRGGGLTRVPWSQAEAADEVNEQMLRLDRALTRLETHDARKAAIVKLRYFAGFTAQEIADLLSVSPSTVNHEWAFARAWLAREMGAGPVPAAGR